MRDGFCYALTPAVYFCESLADRQMFFQISIDWNPARGEYRATATQNARWSVNEKFTGA